MNDSNYSYLEASAKRKKRNQFISILIIVAVVLVVVIGWGIREFKKAQDAERIKNALNSQVEPAFPSSTENSEASGVPDSSSMTIQEMPAAASETTSLQPTVQTPAPSPEPLEKPVAAPVEPPPPKVTAAPKKKNVEAKPHELPSKKMVETKETGEDARLAMVKPEPKSPQIVAPPPQPTEPVKSFAPEDLPVPEKVEPSEDGAKALASLPTPKVEAAPANTPDGASSSFKTGLEAYRQQDFVNAIRSFAALPKPASRKRGDSERDEFVQGNFLRGVALLKMGHISEAASAFLNTLEYEKYYPLANMNLGICYVELKQYAKAHKAFEAVIRDQSFIEPAMFDDVMQRTKYFWALAWTRLYKSAKDVDRQNYYRQQATLRWKDYQVWFSKNDRYKSENQKADNYLKSLAPL